MKKKIKKTVQENLENEEMKKCPEKISNTITKKDEIKIGKDETE